jgi:hypothetical protein
MSNVHHFETWPLCIFRVWHYEYEPKLMRF